MHRWQRLISATIMASAICVPAAQAPSGTPAGQEMRFADQIKAFQDQDRTAPPPQQAILFIGSSIFRQWTNVKEHMAPLPVFNRAFGGSRTWEVLHYMDQVVLPYRPRIIVYYTGSNDVNAGESASAIVSRTKAFISRTHSALPDTRVYYVAINRSPDKRARWNVVDAVNGDMKTFAATSSFVRYIDLNPVLFDATGEPRAELYREDGLHFHPPAYDLFAAIIKPILTEAWQQMRPMAADLAAQQTSSIADRLPRFVNREQNDRSSRADWLEPAGAPYPLGSSDRSFTVEYTHRGKRLTLNDYFTRTDVLGFLVLHDGRNVLERYFHGTGPSDRYLSMSVSKSIVSVAVGAAVDEGRINLDDPVTKYLPRLRQSGYRDATVRHVLWMATGIQFSEEYGSPTSGIGQLSAANRNGTPSFEEFAATLPSERVPGQAFNYQSINTQVLGEVLEEATGVPLNVYVERQLWKKIGTESRAYFLTGAKQPGICAYGCFYATLRDYARFGLMAMRGGILTDQRVVSERWIKESAAPAPFAKPTVDPKTGLCRRGYGFQWWVPCGPDPAFQAVGINGQAVYVNPVKRVVIAQFSSWPQAGASDEIRGEGATVFDAIVARLSR